MGQSDIRDNCSWPKVSLVSEVHFKQTIKNKRGSLAMSSCPGKKCYVFFLSNKIDRTGKRIPMVALPGLTTVRRNIPLG